MDLKTHEKLAAIQQELKAPKNQYNSFGKYYYRSAEDILEAIKPFEKKYSVTFHVDEELMSIDNLETPIVYTMSTAIMTDHSNGNIVTARGNAIIDFEAKGMQMPQRTGAASSYSKKYALGNLLLLDDTKDPDATNKHGKGGATSKAPTTPKTPAKPTLKTMTDAVVESLIKGIEQGKFGLVEQHLVKYKDDSKKKAVLAALTKAKSGK